MKLFVYGTLMRGQSRNSVLSTSHYLGPAMTIAKLYDLGAYPGIKRCAPGEELFTVGEMYEVSEEILMEIDHIEGYDSSDLKKSLYLREVVSVQFLAEGSSIEAMTYFYNKSVKKNIFIHHGDYRKYLSEK